MSSVEEMLAAGQSYVLPPTVNIVVSAEFPGGRMVTYTEALPLEAVSSDLLREAIVSGSVAITSALTRNDDVDD